MDRGHGARGQVDLDKANVGGRTQRQPHEALLCPAIHAWDGECRLGHWDACHQPAILGQKDQAGLGRRCALPYFRHRQHNEVLRTNAVGAGHFTNSDHALTVAGKICRAVSLK